MWCTLQDYIYIVGCDAVGGPWRHPRWISLKMRNDQKPAEIENFDACHVEHNTLCCFLSTLCVLSQRKGKTSIFIQKWLDYPRLMTLSRNHSNQFSPDLCRNACKGNVYSRWKWQVLMINHLEKNQKNLKWEWHHPRVNVQEKATFKKQQLLLLVYFFQVTRLSTTLRHVAYYVVPW